MQAKLSRRKLAQYVVANSKDGIVPSDIIDELAAYLVSSGRQRELTLVVRAIEDMFEESGVVIATVTSARPLDGVVRERLVEKIDAEEVHLREVIDETIIGGLKLETPSASVDVTVRHKLSLLGSAKV